MNSTVFAIVAIVTPLTFWYLLLFRVPSVAHSLYRHRLWRIRDAVVDDLLDGRLAPSKSAARLLFVLHTCIGSAARMTVLDAAVIALVSPRSSAVARSVTIKDLVIDKDASATDRERLAKHVGDLAKAGVLHAGFGSPSGWAATAIFVVYAICAIPVWILRGRRDDVLDVVRDTAEREAFGLSIKSSQAMSDALLCV